MPPKPKVEKDVPPKVILPSPLELAKLATAFLPDNPEDRGVFALDAAIQEAAKLYLRAHRFHTRHENDTLEEFAEAVGDGSFLLAACRTCERQLHRSDIRFSG